MVQNLIIQMSTKLLREKARRDSIVDAKVSFPNVGLDNDNFEIIHDDFTIANVVHANNAAGTNYGSHITNEDVALAWLMERFIALDIPLPKRLIVPEAFRPHLKWLYHPAYMLRDDKRLFDFVSSGTWFCHGDCALVDDADHGLITLMTGNVHAWASNPRSYSKSIAEFRRKKTRKVWKVGKQWAYTPQSALIAKQKIESDFIAGRITFDKKRGMKMLVTKATRGWSGGASA